MKDISIIANVDPATANLINGAMKEDIIPNDGKGTPLLKAYIQDSGWSNLISYHS